MRYFVIAVLLAVAGFAIWSRTTRVRLDVHSPCIPSLQNLQVAKEVWALEQHKTTNDIPTDADLFGPRKYLVEKPKCPAGGVYTLGRVGEKVRCSIPGHTL